eukprot:307068-Chlamydomonas_euryale.AAC.2
MSHLLMSCLYCVSTYLSILGHDQSNGLKTSMSKCVVATCEFPSQGVAPVRYIRLCNARWLYAKSACHRPSQWAVQLQTRRACCRAKTSFCCWLHAPCLGVHNMQCLAAAACGGGPHPLAEDLPPMKIFAVDETLKAACPLLTVDGRHPVQSHIQET